MTIVLSFSDLQRRPLSNYVNSTCLMHTTWKPTKICIYHLSVRVFLSLGVDFLSASWHIGKLTRTVGAGVKQFKPLFQQTPSLSVEISGKPQANTAITGKGSYNGRVCLFQTGQM